MEIKGQALSDNITWQVQLIIIKFHFLEDLAITIRVKICCTVLK